MRNIGGRLEGIEKQLNIGRKIKASPHIILSLSYAEGTAPDVPEQTQDWITYQRAQREAVETETGIVLFVADPFGEYEARNNLPEGILFRNEYKGKIPFSELLEKATKSNQKQPNTEK